MSIETRWKCRTCGLTIQHSEFLRARNPFDPDDTVLGCPHCCSCGEGFVSMCDIPECDYEADCYWPSKDGYRHTCHKHYEEGQKNESN